MKTHGTLTFCWDTVYPVAWKPGRHVNRWRRIRSVRVWWLWFAVAYYRMDDAELVHDRHTWSEPLARPGEQS